MKYSPASPGCSLDWTGPLLSWTEQRTGRNQSFIIKYLTLHWLCFSILGLAGVRWAKYESAGGCWN